jgi:hypothetical protein
MKEIREMTKREFAELFARSPLAAESAVLKLYERQTEQEQASKQTLKKNYVGFSAADAKVLSRAGKWIRWNRSKAGSKQCYLSPENLAKVQQRLPRYWRQLNDILAAKAAS